ALNLVPPAPPAAPTPTPTATPTPTPAPTPAAPLPLSDYITLGAIVGVVILAAAFVLLVMTRKPA
ncbi:MAG: hypothetical protein ACE5PO_03955, partial [Candidatus Bathyarchaeia archaeon]